MRQHRLILKGIKTLRAGEIVHVEGWSVRKADFEISLRTAPEDGDEDLLRLNFHYPDGNHIEIRGKGGKSVRVYYLSEVN